MSREDPTGTEVLQQIASLEEFSARTESRGGEPSRILPMLKLALKQLRRPTDWRAVVIDALLENTPARDQEALRLLADNALRSELSDRVVVQRGSDGNGYLIKCAWCKHSREIEHYGTSTLREDGIVLSEVLDHKCQRGPTGETNEQRS